MVECSVEFDFDIDANGLESFICKELSVPVGTKTRNLNDIQYNEVCDLYGVPRIDEKFTIDIDQNSISEYNNDALYNELTDHFGWAVMRVDYELVEG